MSTNDSLRSRMGAQAFLLFLAGENFVTLFSKHLWLAEGVSGGTTGFQRVGTAPFMAHDISY
ncbi:MAG: hypothetical protein JNM22_04545 [Saprospiraceae bacterium]|nr:hypothetical protein [Saprospiraceae bacterium]